MKKRTMYLIYFIELVILIALIIYFFMNPNQMTPYTPYLLMIPALGIIFNLWLLKKKDKSKN